MLKTYLHTVLGLFYFNWYAALESARSIFGYAVISWCVNISVDKIFGFLVGKSVPLPRVSVENKFLYQLFGWKIDGVPTLQLETRFVYHIFGCKICWCDIVQFAKWTISNNMVIFFKK